jgi:hypothetical protein
MSAEGLQKIKNIIKSFVRTELFKTNYVSGQSKEKTKK